MSQQGITDSTQQSDYEAVGGGQAIRAVVDRFYELVVGDPRLTSFFEGVDMPALKRHQALLVSQVMGGPAEYDGRSLKDAHAQLNIGNGDFDAVVQHLVDTLNEFKVPQDIIGRVGATLSQTRSDIVTAN
jgi:hemoglobin